MCLENTGLQTPTFLFLLFILSIRTYFGQLWSKVDNITNMAVLTFADCPVASVARLTGAAVASDHVKAQGVLITVVEPTKALVML